MSYSIEKLQSLSARLASLVASPEHGLFAWNEAVADVLREIAALAPPKVLLSESAMKFLGKVRLLNSNRSDISVTETENGYVIAWTGELGLPNVPDYVHPLAEYRRASHVGPQALFVSKRYLSGPEYLDALRNLNPGRSDLSVREIGRLGREEYLVEWDESKGTPVLVEHRLPWRSEPGAGSGQQWALVPKALRP